MKLSLIDKCIYLSLPFIFLSCEQDVRQSEIVPKKDFNRLTSYFFQFEESNRIDFRKFVVENHLNGHVPNQFGHKIIELYDIIDTVTHNLLVKSGGYDPESAELIGGSNFVLAERIIKEFDLYQKIENKFKSIQQLSSKNPSQFPKESIEDIESCLHPILSDFWNYESLEGQTVAKIYLELMIMQNRLLVVELKHYNRLTDQEINK